MVGGRWMSIKTLLNFYHTVIHLKPRQVYFQIKSRLFKKTLRINYSLSAELKPLPPITHFVDRWTGGEFDCESQTFEFLEKTISYPEKINWQEQQFGGLWLDHLHYFRYLDKSNSENIALHYEIIKDWKENCKESSKAFFPPYNASERAFCLGRWLIQYRHCLDEDQYRNIMSILVADIDFVSDNLEWHLDGNHLLKNLAALWWGCKIINADITQKWKLILNKHLKQTISEQISRDGLHYEKSAIYHQLALIDFLDIYMVTNADDNDRQYLKTLVQKMAGALKMLTHPDGKTCLFNDSSANLTSPTRNVLSYCESILDEVPSVNSLQESGYYKFSNDVFYLAADFGDMGPDEQMGHAHSDMLHFELSYKGIRVLVEGGTSSYYDPQRRAYERSTRAHNTVTIGGRSQSKNWGNFRVAQRGKCAVINSSHSKDHLYLEAEHDAYKPNFNTIHKRSLKINSSVLSVHDQLITTGYSPELVRSYLHFSDKCNITRTSVNSATIMVQDIGALSFRINNATFELKEMHYSQKYNELTPGTVIIMKPINNQIRFSFNFRIRI